MDNLLWIFVSAMVNLPGVETPGYIPGVETPGYSLSPLRGGELDGWGSVAESKDLRRRSGG